MAENSHVQGDTPPGQLLLQFATAYMLSAALQVAARLEIAEALAHGPRHVSALAKDARVREDGLYRVLRALASVGIFSEKETRVFALTPPAELLRPGVPGSLHNLVTFMSDPFHFRVYAELLHSVQTGQPAGEKVVGMPVFEYLRKDREESDRFNDAMTSLSAMCIPAVLDAYDFGGIDTLVDVAGGHGEVISSVLRKYPAMKGVLFDVDHVIAGSAPRIASMGLQDRCRTEAGDFFAAVPRGADAYLMKHIIHDWDDERAAVILGNIRRALEGRAGGRLILLEAVVPAGNTPDLSKLLDLEMLLLPGGRERNTDDFGALFARTGFTLTSVTPTRSPVSVIEARPT